MEMLSRLGYALCFSIVVIYGLFQKRLLPHWLSKIVSRIFFLPTFPITALLRLGNYWSEIDDTIILGCAPIGFLQHPQILHRLGVRGVINTCYEYSGPTSYYRDLYMKQLRLPVVDHCEPSLSQMIEAVAFISYHYEKHQRVYIHCKAGHGRSAAIALCWLIMRHPDTPLEELSKILSAKRKVRTTLHKQRNIIDFAAYIREQKNIPLKKVDLRGGVSGTRS